MKIYKIEWEFVPCWGDAFRFYTGDNPNVKPSEVPDGYWQKVEKQTDNPFQQYNTLKEWASSGTQLIRRVKLYVGETKEIEWKEFE